MSHIHDGPLATYNALADPNLAGYFGNTRMRRQLRRSGLVSRRGEIISENQYRINMARKEHKKHVKNLLAQAIVHKTLDLERYRQVEIKRKLEEIAKIELVRRVRAEDRQPVFDLDYRDGEAERKRRQDEMLLPLLTPRSDLKKKKSLKLTKDTRKTLVDMERPEMKDNLMPSLASKAVATRGRKGDEEVLPYLSPRSHSRPQSGHVSETSSGKRPKSAPSRPRHRVHPSNGYVDPYHDVIYVDDDGRPVSPPPSDRQSQMKTEELDSRHLYALDSEALQKYAAKLSKMERGRDGATSPYVISQFPTPPRRPRSERSSPRRSGRMSQSPPYREKRPGSVRDGQLVTSDKDPDTVEGGLMLHRQEPAMMHQGEVQTLCEITMKYHGPNLTLPRDQRDPTQEVSIDQQHCGGNTLPVFKERLRAGSSFSFISRRHRGYPFSLTMYIDGRVDCRVSTCCEYKHAVGVKLGGKMGHFSLTGITGATPCYKCKLSVQAPPRGLKLKKSGRKKRPEQLREEVIVDGTPRTAVDKEGEEEKKEVSGHDDDDYEDDFDEDDDGKDIEVPIPVDIKTASDIAILNQVNEMGKRVVLEIEEHHPDNISAIIQYDDNSDTVIVKKFKRATVPEYMFEEGEEEEGDEEEGETDASFQGRPDEPGATDDVVPRDLAGRDYKHVHGNVKSGGSISSPLPSDTEPRLSRAKISRSLKYDSDAKSSGKSSVGSRSIRSAAGSDTKRSVISRSGSESVASKSVSVASRSRDSSRSARSKTVANSSPEWLSSWTYNQTLKEEAKVQFEAEAKRTAKVKRAQSARILRPPSAMREMNPHEMIDVERLRRSFYPPAHDCLGRERQRLDREKFIAKAKSRSARSRDRENINLSVESLLGTMAKTENNINTVIADVSESISHDKNKRINIKIPNDSETADEVSDIELDYKTEKQKQKSNTININLNIDTKKAKVENQKGVENVKQARPKSSLSRQKEKPEKPGVSKAYAEHVLKTPKSELKKKIKDNTNRNRQGTRSVYPKRHDCLTHMTRARSPVRARSRSPSPKRVSFKSDINNGKKEIIKQTEIGKEEIEEKLLECLETFGQKLQEQNQHFADQLKETHTQFSQDLTEAQSTLTACADSLKGNLSDHLLDAKNNLSGQLVESQNSLKSQFEDSQKALFDQFKESQSIFANQVKDSQTTFGDFVKESQTLFADQLKNSQTIFGEQVQESQRLLSDQLAESQKTLTNQMTDAQEVFAEQVKESQVTLADQVKDSQQLMAEQLKQSQDTMAEQVKEAQQDFAGQLQNSKQALSTQLTESQDAISAQVSESQTKIADDLQNAQQSMATQLEEQQQQLSEQLSTAQETIEKQLQETQEKITEKLADTQQQIDNHLGESIDRISKQEEDARERMEKESEESRQNIKRQEEMAKLMLMKESEDTQKRLQEQEEAARVKLKQESDETQRRLAEQEAEAKQQMEKEREETQRRLEEQERKAKEEMEKEREETQRRISEQEEAAKEKLARESEESAKRLAEQEQKAREELEKDSAEVAKRLEEQEQKAKENMAKEGEETARRLAEQEEKAKQELQKESEESAKRLADQEHAAKESLVKEGIDSARRLQEQEEKAREEMKKDSEETAKRLQEQEQAARDSLLIESEESAKKLAEQEKLAKEKLQIESKQTQTNEAVQKAGPDVNQNYLQKKDVPDGRGTPERADRATKKESETEKQYDDDFEEEEPPPTPKSDRREIIGLKADEVRENGRTISVDVKEQEEKEKQEEEDAVLPLHRKIESYSSEDEDVAGGRKQQVKVDVHTQKKTDKKRRSSSSSSSSSASSREASPRVIPHDVKVHEVAVTPVKKVEKQEEEPAHVSVASARSEESSLPKTDRSTTSSNSLTTETESMLEPRSERKTELVIAKPKTLERQRSVSSSSSSSSSSDSEDERLERKRRERKKKEEEEKRKKEEAERDLERKKKAEEDEQRRKKEDDERKKKFELERQLSQERMKAFEIERKKRDAEMEAKKAEQERIKEEEKQKRLMEEQRMKEQYESELKRMKEQRENEQKAARQGEKKTEERRTEQNNVEVEKQYDRFADMRFKQVRTEMKPINQEREQQDASFLEVKSEITPQKKVAKSSSSSDSSSSSSESESESERKKETKKAPSPEPQPRKVSPPPSPPKVVDKKPQPIESSSSSTTTTSGSSSGSESEREKEKAPVTTMTTIEEEKVEKKREPDVKPTVRKSSSSSSSSSSSDSESDSETADKKKSPQPQPPQPQPARVPSPEVKTSTQEVPTPVKKSPPRRSSSSSTTSSSSSDSESEPKPPQPQKKVSPPPFGGLQHEQPLDEKDVKVVKAELEKQPVKKPVSSSEDSSSDSSSSGSDSETESEPSKIKTKQTPKSATSESEGETMHGGADPEHVADGAPKGSTLAQSKVAPAEPQEGSIMGIIQGKSDIDLNGVLLNEDQIAQLSSYIVEAEHLSMLSLRNSGLTDHTFGRLALAIQLTEAKPKILNLGLNELGPESVQPLTAALTKTPSVEVLILNGNPIGDEGYRKLVSSMVSTKDLFPFLRRSSGYMTPSETRDLNPDNSSKPLNTESSKLTPGACKLTELGLAETSITDTGIWEISQLLETNTTLTSLNLNGNKNITKEGWARLSQALARNTTLKNLSMDFCHLGDDGIAILSKGLRVNTALRSLELECTGLTEKGGLLLRDLLKENTSILQVTAMPGNSISEGMMAEIRKYLALNNAGYSSS